MIADYALFSYQRVHTKHLYYWSKDYFAGKKLALETSLKEQLENTNHQRHYGQTKGATHRASPLQPWSAQIVNLSEQTSAVFHNDSGTQKCPAIYLFTEQTQVARLSQLSQIAKSKLCYKRIVIKKILSRALVGSDYHFIGTRCLSKSLELIVKPTQLFLLQIHFEIAFKRH